MNIDWNKTNKLREDLIHAYLVMWANYECNPSPELARCIQEQIKKIETAPWVLQG